MQSPELFAALTNRSILDQRFASSLSEQTIPFLNEVAKYLRERLAREGNTIASQKRLEKLVADVEKKLTQIYGDIDALYMEEFKALSADEGKFVANAMAAVVVDDVIVEPVTNQRLWAAVVKNPLLLNNNNEYVDFRQFVKSLGDNAQKVARSISGGYVLGQTVQEMTQTIVGTRANNYQDGMVDSSRRQAEMIVRTSVNHIATQAHEAVYQANRDLIYGYRIVATLDTRTSAICRGYDNQVFRYDARFNPMPPLHYYCRSRTTPEMYSTVLKETGATRSANFKAREDAKKGTVGQVSAQTQYYELLKRQPKAQQDLVLGKSRGLIFRNSGLSAEEFRQAMTDSMGRPLTLKEMAAENDKILSYMQSNSFLREYLDD